MQKNFKAKAQRTINAIYMRIFLAGYGGWIMPTRARRLIAGTMLHRAWLIGYLGFFEEDGIAYGPANPYGMPDDLPDW